MTNQVRQLMLEAGLKPAELAYLTNLTPTTIYRIISNETKSIDIDNLEALCIALDCGVLDIYPAFLFSEASKELRETIQRKKALL